MLRENDFIHLGQHKPRKKRQTAETMGKMAYKRSTKETTLRIVKAAGTKIAHKSRFPSIIDLFQDEFKKR